MSPRDNFSAPDFIDRLKNRDQNAIQALVEAYTTHLFKAALGLGFTEVHAGELVQNTWATFFDVVPNFKGKSHIRTFLFGILYNKASEARRDQAKHGSVDPIENILEKRFDHSGNWVNPPTDPETFLMASETLDIIKICLEQLPLNQRAAFCLKEIESNDSTSICKIMDVSVTNLGVLLFRARNRLRECIERKSGRKAT